MARIALHGISGSGKTTVGRALAELLGCPYIDQDSFYLREKPLVRLSDGSEVRNWDTMEAIDETRLRDTLSKAERSGRDQDCAYICGGFALRGLSFDTNVLLQTGDTQEQIIARCIAARQQSKGFSGPKAQRDSRMVREVVYPYYCETVSLLTELKVVKVYHGEQRRFVCDLVAEICGHLEVVV